MRLYGSVSEIRKQTSESVTSEIPCSILLTTMIECMILPDSVTSITLLSSYITLQSHIVYVVRILVELAWQAKRKDEVTRSDMI
jgi:hypothetical protein